MERSNFFDTQYVLPEDLNNIESTAAHQLKLRSQAQLGTAGGVGKAYTFWSGSAVPGGGIFGSPADYLLQGSNFYPFLDSTSQITIASGSALDVNGELVVADTYTSIPLGQVGTHYSWLPNISTTNYIKLAYLETSGSVKASDIGTSYSTRYYGSYFITINSTVPIGTDILLGTFIADSNGAIVGSIQDRRTYVRTFINAKNATFDPRILAPGIWSNLEDHVKATGSASATTTNPHGLTIGDIFAVGSTGIYLIPASASVVFGTVYQNPSGSSMFLSCAVQLALAYPLFAQGTNIPQNVSLQISSTTGSVGVLGGTIYEVSRRDLTWLSDAPIAPAEYYDYRASVAGFVPPRWYYKIDFPKDVIFSYFTRPAVIMSTVRYW